VKAYGIVGIRGDGIGPELVDATLAILDAVQSWHGGFRMQTRFVEAGARHYRATGTAISDEAVAACGSADAVLKGPVGLPDVRHPDGTEAGLLGGKLRMTLDLFANVRPIKLWPGVGAPLRAEPGTIDYVVVRENTEGLYASRGRGVANAWAAADTLLMTRAGVERIVRFAFEVARGRAGAPADGVRRVTCVHKANVLRSFAFFRDIFDELATGYADIAAEHLHTDAAAQALVTQPGRFDVIVTENFVGDLLSELGGGTVGGVGMCPSGNVGAASAYFEPIHGSAPTLAGRDVANPISQVLSAALMLDHLGERRAGDEIRGAVGRALASGAVSIAPNGRPVGGTARAAERIRDEIGSPVTPRQRPGVRSRRRRDRRRQGPAP
jgi:isocitrate/isopropylmalate dehydrogenase